ncbi:hypothetical protein DDZ13_05415 [Coraliomargarita sinensis]|uniref:Lipoprotein n=1 Tax=Coraliomargarita sinensis TaxID=2174842 RepID=A0A317ZI08_9BACT|nr:hypothetical protein [Coraliomargarita sinensis]PXA04612.1 hypothetical protein DDZ13_05415 [Coraliomargarita sinensis]
MKFLISISCLFFVALGCSSENSRVDDQRKETVNSSLSLVADLESARDIDLNLIERHHKLRIRTLDKSLVRAASAKTFFESSESPDVILLKVRFSGGTKSTGASGGFPILKDWYRDNYFNGWRIFEVIKKYSGECPPMIVIDVKQSPSFFEHNYKFLKFRSTEWVVALKPKPKGELGSAPEDMVYDFYGHSLFSAIPVAWPDGLSVGPYFGGIFSLEEAERLIEIILASKL